MKRLSMHVLLSLGLAALFCAAGPRAWAASGVLVTIAPADTNVAQGEQFDLEFTLPDSSAEFNAFELEVQFDNTILSLVSNQEGPLMTSACGSRFHVFNETDGMFTVTDGLLCSGVKVSGPGVIYRLRFQADTTDVTTSVVIQSAGFSNAGVNVTPVQTENAQVTIGNVIGVPDGDPETWRARLHAPFPNPFRRAVQLGFTAQESGEAVMEIYSITGRRVRRLLDNYAEIGISYPVVWDGADERGQRVPPGIYFVRLATGSQVQSNRIVRIQ